MPIHALIEAVVKQQERYQEAVHTPREVVEACLCLPTAVGNQPLLHLRRRRRPGLLQRILECFSKHQMTSVAGA